ncbi:hypothetical protein GCM10010123_15610 [Pilimelia anulata]|uniref:HTH cro/C1-type domain-containing protein n=1 Tax=Pilimelia anulata TaxID=53371 RepID=A0A8J3B651_9ACTN|nr:helix-turn-helix domain-containing protein [Pilimelia anulata]GGJ86923.1 hypothetical protein GCM10010123_15610 [Pilimelia anulata]
MEPVARAEFAARLAELRRARRLPLRALAEAALSCKSNVHDYEHGRKVPDADTAHRLDRALGADGELARLLDGGAVLPRREFVASAVALPLAARLGVGRRVGVRTVAELRCRTARLRRLDDYLGGADTYAMYRAALADTVALTDLAAPDAVRRQLVAVVAEQAQLAGWAAFDAGWHAPAGELFRLSLTAAHEAEHRALAGNAWAFLGYQEQYRGRDGVAALTAGTDTAGTAVTPRVAALLWERRAHAHATAGQTREVEQALDRAERAVHEPADADEPDWVFWVDPPEIEIMRGRCWSLLHRPLRAIAALERALARYADTHARDKALYSTFLVDAYLDANEVTAACDTAHRAIDPAAGVGSLRPRQRLREISRRLGDDPAERDLRDRVAAWTGTTRP